MTSGKNSNGSGMGEVCPETDGREETGGTGQYGFRRLGEGF